MGAAYGFERPTPTHTRQPTLEIEQLPTAESTPTHTRQPTLEIEQLPPTDVGTDDSTRDVGQHVCVGAKETAGAPAHNVIANTMDRGANKITFAFTDGTVR